MRDDAAVAEIERLTKANGHVAYVCPGDHEHGGWSCMFCAGDLFSCIVCGAFEGATPTQCPGEKMTPDVFDRVYAGDIDFRDGEWHLGMASLQSPSGWVERCKAYGYYWKCSRGHANATPRCSVHDCGEYRPAPAETTGETLREEWTL